MEIQNDVKILDERIEDNIKGIHNDPMDNYSKLKNNILKDKEDSY